MEMYGYKLANSLHTLCSDIFIFTLERIGITIDSNTWSFQQNHEEIESGESISQLFVAKNV